MVTIGQSFTACRDGQIEFIKIRVNTMDPGPQSTILKIARGANTSCNVLHTQNVTINGMGDLTIRLNRSLPVINGAVYSFSLGGSGDAFNIGYSTSLGDVYTGGTLFRNTTPIPTGDLYFRIGFGAVFIPTMGQWSLFIFGRLILNMGVFSIRRRVLV